MHLALFVFFALIKAILLASERVLIVGTLPDDNCNLLTGYRMIVKTLANKIDYCRFNHYDLKIFQKNPDPALHDHWNKVGSLYVAMKDSIAAEAYDWIVWADYDLLFLQLNRPIKFSKYKDKNIVVGGFRHAFETAPIDCFKALNTGVIYFRVNGDTLKFIEEWRKFGMQDVSEQNEKCAQIMTNFFHLQDQKAFIWQLYNNKHFLDMVQFAEYDTINGYWESYLAKDTAEGVTIGGNPFIKHWCGCKFCNSEKAQMLEKCYEDFKKTNDLFINNYII